MSFDNFTGEEDGGEADVGVVDEIGRECFGGGWC